MTEEDNTVSPLVEVQASKLKELDLLVTDHIGTMPVIECIALVKDARTSTRNTTLQVRLVLGNDIDIPQRLMTSHHQYPNTGESPSVYAATDILNTAMARTLGLIGYSPEEHWEEEREAIKIMIDTNNEAVAKGLGPAITVLTAEGRIWKDGKHLLDANESKAYYTEIVLGKIKEKYYSDYPITPIVLLASCNEDKKTGRHADINPPEGINLIYVDGLASIYDPGKIRTKFQS